MTKLPYKVECNGSLPFFELIAAFNCARAALWYAAECRETNHQFIYRVTYGGKEIAVAD